MALIKCYDCSTEYDAEVIPRSNFGPQKVKGICPSCLREIDEYSLDHFYGPEDEAYLRTQFLELR
jgi:hypothetical protein